MNREHDILTPEIRFHLIRKMERHKVIALAGPRLLPHERKYLEFHAVSGVILFARNIESLSQVGELITQLKEEGIGIFLISHDIHDVFDLADRLCVMKNGRVVGTAPASEVTKDEVLGMIILGKCPPGATPGPGAMTLAA